MSSMTEVQPAPVEDDVPAPPLKKRATKRGLCRMVNAAPADEPATESHNVYSSCVAQSFSNFHRKPLFSKQCNRNTKIPSDLPEPPRPKREVQVVASIASEPPSTSTVTVIGDEIDDEDEIENSILSTDDVSIVRSPSPPVPPPPPVPARTRPKRVSKGIRNALKTLDSMKDELRKGLLTSPPTPTVVDDSPQCNDTQVVRVRHMDDIHRFSMTKTDMFYSLQQQMANVLHVDAGQIGLFLNDRHLAASDTPQSTRLHLADIIVCHVLVPGERGSGDADVADSDSVRVLMQCPNNRQNLHLVVKKHLPFKVMMEKYAEMRGKPTKSFKFCFDGELLTPDMLPSDVDLDEDDTIDVIEAKG